MNGSFGGQRPVAEGVGDAAMMRKESFFESDFS
jgi:hypothetical protein